MADITIIVIEAGEARKKLKKLLPPQIRSSLDQAGLDLDMESNEQLRDKQPAGFPSKFTVPEEVLTFVSDSKDSDALREGRKKLRDRRNALLRKKLPGNGE